MTATHPSPLAPTPSSPPPAPPRLWLRRILTVVLAGLIFFAGIVTGAAITVKIIRTRISEAILHPEKGRELLLKQLTKKLILDGDQQKKIGSIIESRQKDMLSIRVELQPRVEQVITKGKSEIEEVLKPDQMQKWNEFVEDKRSRWRPPMPGDK
jgi:hypothetical protein